MSEWREMEKVSILVFDALSTSATTSGRKRQTDRQTGEYYPDFVFSWLRRFTPVFPHNSHNIPSPLKRQNPSSNRHSTPSQKAGRTQSTALGGTIRPPTSVLRPDHTVCSFKRADYGWHTLKILSVPDRTTVPRARSTGLPPLQFSSIIMVSMR